jgi:hypothetical protein
VGIAHSTNMIVVPRQVQELWARPFKYPSSTGRMPYLVRALKEVSQDDL